MGVGRVGAYDEDAIRVVHIVVAGRWCVRAQSLLVARHRAAHAQAGVGVDVVGADHALDQFVEDVIVLRQQLAAEVKAHRVRAMVLNDLGELVSYYVYCSVPRHIGGR